MSSEPKTKTEIIDALKLYHEQGINFWSAIDAHQFSAPLGAAWSPAQNVGHLIKSTKPVTKALHAPRMALRAMFGAATRPSVSYNELVDNYRQRVAGGVDTGKFAPEAEPQSQNPGARQEELVGEFRTAVKGLAEAAESWSEEDLDKYQIPHPLLGPLTLREMLMFTLYHYGHHRANVIRYGVGAAD